MARDYARVKGSIWADDDFRVLPIASQWLYFHLLTTSTLNYAGVADWRPARIAALTGNGSAADIEEAALHLEHGRFVVIDRDSEEALVRSFLRHDGLMAQPNVAAAMVKDFACVVSKALRGVFVHELQRLHEADPELRGWKRKDVSELLTREPMTPEDAVSLVPPNPSGNPSPNPSANGSGSPSVNGSRRSSGEGSVDPCPTPLPTPAPTPNSLRRGEVTYSSDQADGVDQEPPLRCFAHTDTQEPPKCGACKDARLRHEAWELVNRRPPPMPPKCDACDPNRYLVNDDGDPIAKCPTCHPGATSRRTA
jgi:hypothetical protein